MSAPTTKAARYAAAAIDEDEPRYLRIERRELIAELELNHRGGEHPLSVAYQAIGHCMAEQDQVGHLGPQRLEFTLDGRLFTATCEERS